MWWTAFTFIDLYLGLVLLDSLIPTLPEQKRLRATSVKKIVILLLIATAIAFITLLTKRYIHR